MPQAQTEITPDIAIQRLDGMIAAKGRWISEHGYKRPEWEVDLYRLDREVLARLRAWLVNGVAKREKSKDGPNENHSPKE